MFVDPFRLPSEIFTLSSEVSFFGKTIVIFPTVGSFEIIVTFLFLSVVFPLSTVIFWSPGTTIVWLPILMVLFVYAGLFPSITVVPVVLGLIVVFVFDGIIVVFDVIIVVFPGIIINGSFREVWFDGIVKVLFAGIKMV